MFRRVGDCGYRESSVSFGGSTNVDDLIAVYSNSTNEVKNLLTNECNIYFKCCCCCNFFRNHVEYLTHKFIYCRTLCSAAASAYSAVTPDIAKQSFTKFQNSDHCKREGSSPSNRGEAETSFNMKTRDRGNLKQKNHISVIKKRVKSHALLLLNSEDKPESNTLPRILRDTAKTTAEIMETISHALVTADTKAPDRVPVLHDNSSCHPEMKLCNRKGDGSKNGLPRKVEELKILERMEKYQTTVVDLNVLTCSHSDCMEKQPFSSLFTFAYHLTVKHNRRATSNKRIPCYLCDFESETYCALIEHLNNSHKQYYQEHIAARSICEELKRGRKGKQAEAILIRGKSLSPLSDNFLETEEYSDDSEDTKIDSAAVLESKMNKEVENTELSVKDCLDYIVGIVCVDVEKVSVLEYSKYELNRQIFVAEISSSVLKKKKHCMPTRVCLKRKGVAQSVETIEEAGSSKVLQECDRRKRHEIELPRKRGRGRKPKPKAGQALKNVIENDELSGNSDEAEDDRKRRPSRQRRKPNWINENYVTGFKNKCTRYDDDNVDSEWAQPNEQNQPSSSTEQNRSPSRAEFKCAKSADSQLSTPIESSSTIPGIQLGAGSGETSNSSTPASHQSICNVTTSNHELDDSAERSPLLLFSAEPSSTAAENNKESRTKKTYRSRNNHRGRRMKHRDDLLSNIDKKEIVTTSKNQKGQKISIGSNMLSSDEYQTSRSRRKQDLSTVCKNSDEVIVMPYSNGEVSFQKDLSESPVCLAETQCDLFLSLMRSPSNSNDSSSSAQKNMKRALNAFQKRNEAIKLSEREDSIKFNIKNDMMITRKDGNGVKC